MQHGELAFSTKEFKLGKGEDVRLEVTYLDSRLAIEHDGKPLWIGEDDNKTDTIADARPELLSNYVWPKNTPAPAIVPFTPAEAIAHQEAWAKHLGVPVEIENSIGMKFRVIPPGEFLMGSSEQEIKREMKLAKEKHMLEWVLGYLPFEGPQHRVTLTKPFSLSIHEVTRGQFRQFVDATGYQTEAERSGKGGSGFKDNQIVQAPEFLWNTDLGFKPQQIDDGPVVNVSWNDAVEFCRWLSEKEGVTYRLPWEAEWEFACRSGNEGRFGFGDDVARLSDYTILESGYSLGASRIGQKLPNALGLFDMHGNVWEFCQDWHWPYPANAAIDPTGPEVGVMRAARGGAWGGYGELCRCAYRSDGNAGAYSGGFRVVRTFSVADDNQADGHWE